MIQISLCFKTEPKLLKAVVVDTIVEKHELPLRDFLCIATLNTGQLNPLFHTFAEFRLIVNRIVARQSTNWLAASAQFSP